MELVQLLDIKHPIIQAPMAGVTTPEFVAASAEAGVLGSIGAGYLSAAETRECIREVKLLTKKSFAVNLFVPEKVEATEKQIKMAIEALKPIGRELGITLSNESIMKSEFEGQIQVLIDEEIKICSFTFGLPNQKTVQLLKQKEVFLIGTATTVEEAQLAESAGMDAVVAQGSEAGGHRGSFFGELTFIPLEVLLSEIVNSVTIPIIAAGAIANKERMEIALSNGAQAVQIGTGLLATNESGAHPIYKEAILNAREGATVLTSAFSGKAARGLQNRFTEEMENASIAPYPYQNDLTKEIRKVAGQHENSNFMSLWAGENVYLVQAGSVKDILKKFL